MENVKSFFAQIYDNSMGIQNIVGSIAGIILLVFAIWLVFAFIGMVGTSSEQVYHIPDFAIKIGYVLLWICAVMLLVFGSVNAYKGHTMSGLVGIAFGLLWCLSVVFNFNFDFGVGDNAVKLCMSADTWKIIANKNRIMNWNLEPKPLSNM